MEKARRIAIEILAVFENFLAAKNVVIPNQERDGYEADEGIEKAILFGSEYYALEDEITSILKRNAHEERAAQRQEIPAKKRGDTHQHGKVFKDRCPIGIKDCPENTPFGLRKFEKSPESDNG